jgi:hypothetical protein
MKKNEVEWTKLWFDPFDAWVIEIVSHIRVYRDTSALARC